MRRRYRGAPGVASVALVLLWLSGCGGRRPPEPPSPPPELPSPVVYGEEAEEEPEELPELPVRRLPGGDTLPPALTEQTVTLGTVQDAPLRPLLSALSKDAGINFVVDPAVTGTVTAELRDVSIVQALDYLLTPLGYGFRYRRGAVWITKNRLETRIFSLDYAVTGREGSKALTVGAGTAALGGGSGTTGRFGGAAGGGFGTGAQAGGGAGGRSGGQQFGASGLFGAGGGLGAGTSTVLSGSAGNIYRDLQNGLETILFGRADGGVRADEDEPARAAVARLGLLSEAGDSRAYSRADTAGRQLVINPFAGVVRVTATPEEIEQVERFLGAVERSVHRQVLIEAEIVEVILEDEHRLGLDWEAVLGEAGGRQALLGPAENQSFEVTVSGKDVDAILRALARRNDIRTLASPRTSTLNNQKALLQATTQEVFFSSVQSQPIVVDGTVIPGDRRFVPTVIPVGVVIDVTPQISADGEILMDIRPSVTEIQGVATSPDGDTQPILDVRTIDTMARVRSGQTIVIGGLIEEREQQRETKVPVLGDIPALGGLFRNTETTERRSQLVIFLTPYLQEGMRIREVTGAERLRLEEMLRQP